MKLSIPKAFYNFFVVALYVIAGIFLIYNYFYMQEVPDLRMILFAFAVIAYGIYRGYRAYKDYKLTDKEG